MLPRVFWTLLVLESALNLIVGGWVYSQGGMARGYSLLFLVLLVVSAVLAAFFFFSASVVARLTCTVLVALVGLPSLFLLGTVAQGSYQYRQVARGDADFSGAALQLAHAISDRDVARVRRLIPQTGDLNQRSATGMTLLQFAIAHSDDGDASVESIRALLNAGADPKPLPSPRMLIRAIDSGPRVTRLVLEAGANPNLPDSAKRPAWWSAIVERNEKDPATIQVLLDHGADVHARDASGGPISYAVSQGCWRTVWVLIQGGAGWKEETYEGEPIRVAIATQIRNLEYFHRPVPEELRKALAFYDADAK